jgi:hypothetical protein
MSSGSNQIKPDALRSIDSATFTGNYQKVGTALTQAMRVVKFTNVANVGVTLSWDGVVDNEYLPANSFVLIDISGAREVSDIFEVPGGTQFYVKGAAGVGSFYISCYYGR